MPRRCREEGRAARRPRRDDPRPRRRLARGPLGVQRRAGRAGRRRPSDPGRLRRRATRWTSPWPTSRPTSGRPRRRPPPRSSCPDRLEMAGALRRAADRLGAAPRNGVSPRPRATSPCERRALDRVSPAARLAAAREQVGLLFDRATRAVEARLARAALRRRAAIAASPTPHGRPTRDRAALDAAAIALPRQSAARVAPPGRRSTPRRRRWPSSARRPRSTAATPSSGATPTARSCATRAMPPPGTGLASASRAGEIAATVGRCRRDA